MKYANEVATWMAILTAVIGGSVWVGAMASDVQNNKQAVEKTEQQIDKLRNDTPPAIARLETQVQDVQSDVRDVKESQKEILKELRKK